jgi:hypothetical protein
MKEVIQRILGRVVLSIAFAAMVFLAISYRSARRTEERLQATGKLMAGRCVGIRLLLFSSQRQPDLHPCWMFRYEDIETDRDHYFSLNGKFLAARGSARQLETQVDRWESVGESRRGYLPESRYRDIAIDYLSRHPVTTNLTRFDFATAIPMIPQGRFLPRRVRDIVMLEAHMKTDPLAPQAAGNTPSEILHVFMGKTGQVVVARSQPCWEKTEQTAQQRPEPNR